MIESTIQSLAQQIATYLDEGYQEDAWDFVCVRNNAPQWVKTIWTEAGLNRMIPEKFRSLFFKYAIDALASCDDYRKAKEAMFTEDAKFPFMQASWLLSDHDRRIPMVDRAIEAYGASRGISDVMRLAYLEEQTNVFGAIVVRLFELAKASEVAPVGGDSADAPI